MNAFENIFSFTNLIATNFFSLKANHISTYTKKSREIGVNLSPRDCDQKHQKSKTHFIGFLELKGLFWDFSVFNHGHLMSIL